MIKTGKKIYTQLVERYVDNDKPTGLRKANIPNDIDYVAPVTDYVMCPTPEILNSFEDTTSIPNIYTLAVDVNMDGGSFTIQPTQAGGQYLEGSIVTVSAFSNVGFTLESFEGSEGVVSGNNFVFNMESNKEITINFQRIDIDITIDEGGSVKFDVDGVEQIVLGGQIVNFPYGSLIKIIGSAQGEIVCPNEELQCGFIDGDGSKVILDGELAQSGYEFNLTEAIVLRSTKFCNYDDCVG